MNWLRENWFWALVVGLFTWIHLKMHGAHGHHGHAGGESGGHGLADHQSGGPIDGAEPTLRQGRRRENKHVGS